MGLFGRKKSRAVEVRVIWTGPMTDSWRQIGNGRREWRRDVRLEVRTSDGASHEVERELWVPEWVGIEQLAESGRVLPGEAPAEDPTDVSIDWEAIEEDVTAEVFAKLFHKQGPPEERLALLEDLHARGQFKDELYQRARAELLAEMGEA